jgi:Domain of unknown function (DUF4129)
MPVETFEKTSWDWQLEQMKQQVGEWIEYQFSRFNLALPEWDGREWSIDGQLLLKLLNSLFWLLLGFFLVWIGWRLWQEFSPYIHSWFGTRNSTEIRESNRSSDLSPASLLGRSHEFYRQGNYREACRCLYLAMLEQLHETKVLPHKKSRTDGEYLQLLRLSVTPIGPYETLIITHEQLCFGNAKIESENYLQCQQAYQEIKRLKEAGERG